MLSFFIINYYYADVLIYFLYFKLFAFTQIFAISFYEVLITKLLFSFLCTILLIIPLAPIFLFLYFYSGLLPREYEFYRKYGLRFIWTYILDLFLCFFIFLPFIFQSNSFSYLSSLMQIYSLSSLTYLIFYFLFLWLFFSFFIFFYRFTWSPSSIPQPLLPRRYIPIISLIFGMLGPFGVDIYLQLMFTLALFIYFEIQTFFLFFLPK